MSATLEAFLRSWPFDPWLLGGLLVAAGVYLRGWRALRRRTRHFTASRPGEEYRKTALGRRPPRLLFPRLGSNLCRPRFADRAVRCSLPFRSHASAPAAHDGSAAAVVAGCSTFSLPPRVAGSRSSLLGWALPLVASAPPVLRPADSSVDRARPFRRGDLALARPGGLRHGPALQRLALPATRLLRWRGLALLVSHCQAISRPAILVPLAPAAGTADCRSIEHRSLRPADILRPGALHVLRRGPAPGRGFRRRRSVHGRSPHVGSWVDRLPRAPVRHWRPAASRRGNRQGDKETRREGDKNRQGDKETRREGDKNRQGDKEARRQGDRNQGIACAFRFLSLHLSPCLQVSRSPCLVLTCSLCP